MPDELPDLEVFRKEARIWLDANATLKVASPTEGEDDELEWGVGSDNVAVFHNLERRGGRGAGSRRPAPGSSASSTPATP